MFLCFGTTASSMRAAAFGWFRAREGEAKGRGDDKNA